MSMDSRSLEEPVSIPQILATLLPDGDADRRNTYLQDHIDAMGYEGAVAALRQTYDVVQTGVFVGPPFPPPNAEVQSAEVGPFKIFYHSLYPRELQHRARFNWNFYIGWRGEGLESIMPDWSKRGIVVKITNLLGRWENCRVLTVLPSTRVRITYAGVTREVVFPPDPKEASIAETESHCPDNVSSKTLPAARNIYPDDNAKVSSEAQGHAGSRPGEGPNEESIRPDVLAADVALIESASPASSLIVVLILFYFAGRAECASAAHGPGRDDHRASSDCVLSTAALPAAPNRVGLSSVLSAPFSFLSLSFREPSGMPISFVLTLVAPPVPAPHLSSSSFSLHLCY
ncbi:hypothetical protein GGX14DRAFT_626900 [Mycena pura]|uniref:Uncharacterized protein n=1 Tax=Mycena pura TaxID=153505 RepID=A0AAD6YQL7_9AGAR|nr:hypothetical protein GGX14DRAFT_626900 [Mycena pura]